MTGWTIGDDRKYRTSESGRWRDESRALVMIVNGTFKAAPTVARASVNGATLTLTFNEALDASGAAPAASAFSVAGAADDVSVTGVRSKSGEATEVELTLAPPVAYGDSGHHGRLHQAGGEPAQGRHRHRGEQLQRAGSEQRHAGAGDGGGGSGVCDRGSAMTFNATLSAAVSSDVVLGWSTGDDDTAGARQATADTTTRRCRMAA